MLSSMETPMGVTVIGPTGQSLRLQRSNPAFQAGKEMLRQDMPAEQVWQKLQELLANPLQAIVSWCGKFGLRFVDEGATLRLQDRVLDRAQWLPLLQRCQAVSASPAPVLRIAEVLGKDAQSAKVGELCLHWQELAGGAFRLGVVAKQMLPDEARVGDLVGGDTNGPCVGLVSFDSVTVSTDGAVDGLKGMVIAKLGTDEHAAADVLQEPVILGFNRTYRCEEGTADGWLEDLSFDSLKAARLNAKDIQKSGAEVRIINRVTGEVVSLT